MPLSPLPASFYNRPVLEVARELLGARLVRRLENGMQIAGIITETEAYQGESDLACHARAGCTPRTRVMYGPPGRAYVYFIYGMHWMFNVVAEEEGSPCAVLVRSLLPIEGLDAIATRLPAARRNNTPPKEWTRGPARLCKALDIHGQHNGLDLTTPGGALIIEPGQVISEDGVQRGPRIGIDRTPEPWRSVPWRFWLDESALARLEGEVV
jgi:DNA-3-methyladenine glycosylase